MTPRSDPIPDMPSKPSHLRPGSPPQCSVCAVRSSCPVGQFPLGHRPQLVSLTREAAFRKGENLGSEGQASDRLRILKLGTVSVTRIGPDGLARPIGMVGRGHMLDTCSLFGLRTQLGALALSAGRFCELHLADLQREPGLLQTFVEASHGVMARAMGRQADWGHVMRLRGLPRQLVATLLLLADEQGNRIVRLPSHQSLAALLSSSRESVARTLRQLEERALLRRIDRWHCELTPQHQDVFRDSPDGA